jgi:hypothetical protein
VLRDVVPDTQLAVKPERIRIEPAAAAAPAASGTVGRAGTLQSVSYLGSAYSYRVGVNGQTLEIRTTGVVLHEGRPLATGDAVVVSFERSAATVLTR